MDITKKKVIKDLMLNMIGYFVLTAILQLIIYPILSSGMPITQFGSLLTLMGIANAIAGIFGNSLNNIKLINQDYYKQNNFKDFAIIINKVAVITVVSMVIVTITFHKQLNNLETVFLIVTTVFLMLRSYMNVYYRIQLDYFKIIKHLAVTALGYMLGLIIFRYIKIWPLVFCLGEVFAFIYAYRTTDFKLEKKVKSDKFDKIQKEYIQLATSNCISNLLLYLDRLLINPILGASNVALYYIASVVGKTIGIVMNPITSILLTYLAKIKSKNSKKIFYILSLTSIIMGISIYLISIPLTPIIVRILYSGDYLLAKPYFNFANLSVIIMICGTIINPLLLKNAPMWWQNVIQIVYCIIYLGGSILLMIKWGVYGFCIAGIIANSIKFIMMEIVAYHYIKN